MIVVKNPFSGMPTTSWAISRNWHWIIASQSASDCRLFVGAMFASILATCSLSAKEWKLVEWFDFSTFFALLGLINSLHSNWCRLLHLIDGQGQHLQVCRRCLYHLGQIQHLWCCLMRGCSCTLPLK